MHHQPSSILQPRSKQAWPGMYTTTLLLNCSTYGNFPLHLAHCCLQLVDRLDQGAFGFGAGGTGGAQLTYQGLYRMVAKALYRTHVEGKLKGEIIKASGLPGV